MVFNHYKLMQGAARVASKTLSTEQKARMAQGRRETRIVENYLLHLERRSERKRRPSPEDIERDAYELEQSLEMATGLQRLELLQRREDLQKLVLEDEPTDDAELEKQFIVVAGDYGERKSISYSTWREFGVAKEVLEAADVARTRRPNQTGAN